MLQGIIMDIRERLTAGQFPNEASVSMGIVLRLLHELGWPTYDPQVVAPEYPVNGGRVDFALCHPAKQPAAFIEVKQVGQVVGAEQQLFQYAYHKGVPFVILTDGQEWHFYLPAEQGDYGERRVYKLDILERDIPETVERLERYLKYERICSGEAMEAARADYKNIARLRQIQENLPKAWVKLVEEEDELLIELLATQTESLCGYKPDPDTVAAFLSSRVLVAPSQSVPTKAPAPIIPLKTTSKPLGGQIGYVLFGQAHHASSAREVLIRVFADLAKQDATFLDRFAARPKHGRTRRYLSRTKDELYPGRPDLARDQSYEVQPGWWLGINLSRNAIERVLDMACEVAHIALGAELKLNLG
jgi:predicted type IV restriction endonuclease